MSAHEDVLALLPSYAAGRLSRTESRTLEAHLLTCQECSRHARSVQTLSDVIETQGDALFEAHIEPAKLRALIRSGKPLDEATTRHLRVCGVCSLDAAALMPPANERTNGRGMLPGPAAALAAAALVLGILLGVLASRVQGVAGMPAERLLFLRSLRGEAAAVPVQIGPQEAHLAIAFEPTLPTADPADQIYTIEIAPPREPATWTAAISRARVEQLAGRSGIVLRVPVGGIPDGDAELRLRRQGETEEIIRIPFAVDKHR